MTALGRTRAAILRTIVIVFISQLFHCAYTNPSQLTKQHQPQHQTIPNLDKHQYLSRGLMQATHQFSQPDTLVLRPETEKFPDASSSNSAAGIIVSGLGESASYEESGASLSSPVSSADDQSASASESSAVDRCRELINLALASFNDLPALNVRNMDEIDCDALRAQIAAAASRSLKQMQQQQQRLLQQQQQQQKRTNKAMQQVSNMENVEPEQYSRGSSGASFGISQPIEHMNVSMTGWTPKGSLLSQQMQQVLAQRQLKFQQEQNKLQREMFLATTSTVPPTTDATTFDSLFETTTLPPTTTTTTTTTMEPTTTAPTTTSTTQQPRIRIFPSKRGKSHRNRKSTTTKPSTTSTTTTSKPSTKAEYADGSELSTDYYDEYDDQTTTTTTTARPHRGAGRRKPKRQRTTSTTPRPSTTTTTLSPGYQPRPDGRIIDYLADPNLPRELKGVDLTNYPFYITVPDKIDFECKGRHDGYYTNIDLHCQIYHHCAVGNRYDFLCPNYTLFDQTTFTCRFINTVDCAGSTKHFDRNNDLYVEKADYKAAPVGASTTTTSTTTAPILMQSTASNISSQPPEPRLGIQLSSRARPEARLSALSLIQGSRGTTP